MKDKSIVAANANPSVAVNGNIWVINCKHTNSSAGGNTDSRYGLQIATKLSDNTTVRAGNTGKASYNTDVAINAFFKNLTPSWFGNPGTGWNGNNFTAKYIQC